MTQPEGERSFGLLDRLEGGGGRKAQLPIVSAGDLWPLRARAATGQTSTQARQASQDDSGESAPPYRLIIVLNPLLAKVIEGRSCSDRHA